MAMNRRQRARMGAVGGAAGTHAGAPLPARPAITLEIGEVVLRGIDIGDRKAFAAALERELTVLLGEGRMPRMLPAGARHRVDGGVISLAANHGAPAVGREVARVVQRSLAGPLPDAGEAKISKH
jgi:hypothetical protein